MNAKNTSLSESYFSLASGEWNFDVHFEIRSWKGFLNSDLSFINKMRLASIVVGQYIIGHFSMWTRVDFKKGSSEVRHTTRIKKWRMTFLRSEKKIHLDSDGTGLRLEGVEYYWPLFWIPIPFQPQSGIVEDCGSRARYQMPLLGIACDCQTFLEAPLGEIRVQTKWLRGYFIMTEPSCKKLAERVPTPSLTFKECHKDLQHLVREHDWLRKHNMKVQPTDPQNDLLMFSEGGMILITLERFLRILPGINATEKDTLPNLLQRAVSRKLIEIPAEDVQKTIKDITDVRNTILHGNYEQAARQAGLSSKEDYFKQCGVHAILSALIWRN